MLLKIIIVGLSVFLINLIFLLAHMVHIRYKYLRLCLEYSRKESFESLKYVESTLTVRAILINAFVPCFSMMMFMAIFALDDETLKKEVLEKKEGE